MRQIERHEDWVNPDVDLVGVDSAHNSAAVISAYRTEATSGDYDHLLQTSMLYAGMME